MNEQAPGSRGEFTGENKFTRELQELSNALSPENDTVPAERPAPISAESAGLSEDAYLEQLYIRPEFKERQALIASSRANGDKATESQLVFEQSKFVESRVNAHRAARGEAASVSESVADEERTRQTQLREVLAGLTGEESDDEILRKLDVVNENGEIHLDSPLFHTVTRRAFEMYMKTVEEFSGLSGVEQITGTRVRGIGKADKDRTVMHDLTAELVSTDLGTDFEVSRRLVAKVRDGRVPGSDEQNLYGTGARRAMKTAEQYGYDIGLWADDKLEAYKRAIERLKQNELTDRRG